MIQLGLLEGEVLQNETRRALVLVSKILQSLANDKSNANREDFMEPMQDFLQNNKSNIHEFFDYLASVESTTGDFAPLYELTDNKFREHIGIVHVQLVHSYKNIEALLNEKEQEQSLYNPYVEDLRLLLTQLGPTEDIKPKSSQTQTNIQHPPLNKAGSTPAIPSKLERIPLKPEFRTTVGTYVDVQRNESIKPKSPSNTTLNISQPLLVYTSLRTSSRMSMSLDPALVASATDPRRHTEIVGPLTTRD